MEKSLRQKFTVAFWNDFSCFAWRKRDPDHFVGFTQNRSRTTEHSKNDVFYCSEAISGCYTKKMDFTQFTKKREKRFSILDLFDIFWFWYVFVVVDVDVDDWLAGWLTDQANNWQTFLQ